MNILDELAVPQPPYRMPRPQAVLAMAGEIPIEPTADEPMPAVVPEQVPGAPEQAERSVAETAGEVLAAIERRADAARAQIEQAPPMPEEPAQGPANTQQARGDVDAATADAAARVQAAAARSYETLEDFERERDRLEAIAKENPDSPRGKIAMKGAVLLGPRISEMRAKREEEAAAAAESALRAEQEERARKEDIEFKKSVTRAQTAALKEDAAREEQKLAAGIEFPQQEETAAQRAGRLGREALDALNDFRNAQDRAAKPEEVEFARQRAALAQERADAAKRGEPIPAARVDMGKVESKRLEREISEAQSFDGLYAALRGAGDALVDSRGTALDAEQQISIIEHFRATGEMYMQVPGGRQRPTRSLGILGKVAQLREQEQTAGRAQERADAVAQERASGEGMPEAPVAEDELVNIKPDTAAGQEVEQARAAAEAAAPKAEEELLVVEAEPALGTKNERGEEVVGYSEDGKAVWMLPEEAQPQPAEPEGLDTSRLRPADGQVRPEEVGRQTEASTSASEAAPAPAQTAEQGPTERERRLEDELARLRSEFDTYRRNRTPTEAAVGGGGEQPPAGTAESGLVVGESVPDGEGARQLAELEGIEEMGETGEPGLIDRAKVRLEVIRHDFWGYWWSIWAKRAKDSLKKRDTKIKALEKQGKALAERSFIGTALSPLTYGPRIVWHKWRKGLLEAAQARHDARRVMRENIRNEALNGLAQRYEVARRTYEERAKEYAAASGGENGADQELERLNAKMEEYGTRIARERDPDVREGLVEAYEAYRARYDEVAQEKYAAESKWKDNVKEAERLQSLKNQILKYAQLPGPDTQLKERERLKTRVKRNPKQPLPTAA